MRCGGTAAMRLLDINGRIMKGDYLMEEEKKIPSKYYKEDIHNSVGGGSYQLQQAKPSPKLSYALFSLGKKYKTIAETSGFQMHMCREYDKMRIPNADASKTYLNKNLQGDNSVMETLKHYLSDCEPWRKNQVCAREIMLAASSSFWQAGMSEEKTNLWIAENTKFMRESFGDNWLFGVVHLDENFPHIHALVATKFYDHNKQQWKIQHYKYFDGKEKLEEWQDKYSSHMQKSFPELQRGVKYSKAEFYKIQRFYGMLNEDNLNLSEQDAKTRLQLQSIKLKRLETTIESYRKMNSNLTIENYSLGDENSSLKQENTIILKAVTDLMIRNHIPQKELDYSLAQAQTQSQSKSLKAGS